MNINVEQWLNRSHLLFLPLTKRQNILFLILKQEKVKQRLFYRDGLCWSLVWYANTWSVMESAKGDTPCPFRTAKRFIVALRTAYRHYIASLTAYRLTTKTTILSVSFYIKKLKLQYAVCTCTVILENISFLFVRCFLDVDLTQS